MSKVIRIPKSVFLRLQNHAEPLVDTPANVIEKLLDFYEKNNEEIDMINETEVNGYKKEDETLDFNIFLAPASRKNIKATITNSVSTSIAQKYLNSEQLKSLSEALGDGSSFNCWAMTENSSSYYRTMKKNDYVLFKITGSGYFNYIGRVIYKFKNGDIGQDLWNITPGKPWNLIFILDDIVPIKIDRIKLVEAFGYKSNYDVPGFRRVAEDHLKIMLDKYGSTKKMVDQLGE